MPSTKLLTTPRRPQLTGAARSPRRKPFDVHAKAHIRKLVTALREIGDTPNVVQLLQQYDVSEEKLMTFIQGVESDAFVRESTPYQI